MKKLTILISNSGNDNIKRAIECTKHDDIEQFIFDAKANDNDDTFRNRNLPKVQTDYVWIINDSMDCGNAKIKNILGLIEHEPDIIALYLRFRGNTREWGAEKWVSDQCDTDISGPKKRIEFFNKVYGCYSPPQSRIYRTGFLRDERLSFNENCFFSDCRHNWMATSLAEKIVAVAGYPIYDYTARPLFKNIKWYEHACIVNAVSETREFLKANDKAYLLPVFEQRAKAAIISHMKEAAKYIAEKGEMIWKETL